MDIAVTTPAFAPIRVWRADRKLHLAEVGVLDGVTLCGQTYRVGAGRAEWQDASPDSPPLCGRCANQVKHAQQEHRRAVPVAPETYTLYTWQHGWPVYVSRDTLMLASYWRGQYLYADGADDLREVIARASSSDGGAAHDALDIGSGFFVQRRRVCYDPVEGYWHPEENHHVGLDPASLLADAEGSYERLAAFGARSAQLKADYEAAQEALKAEWAALVAALPPLVPPTKGEAHELAAHLDAPPA